ASGTALAPTKAAAASAREDLAQRREPGRNALRRIVCCLALAIALVGGARLRGARAAGEDTSANAGVPVWAFTVLNYTAVGAGRGGEKVSIPTPDACLAAGRGAG